MTTTLDTSPSGAEAVTLLDVARVAGVSPSTVSRILNGTAVVSKEKREAVDRAIAELGFVPNPIARGLAGGRPVHTVCDAYLGDFPEPVAHEGLLFGACGRMTPARDPLLEVEELTEHLKLFDGELAGLFMAFAVFLIKEFRESLESSIDGIDRHEETADAAQMTKDVMKMLRDRTPPQE